MYEETFDGTWWLAADPEVTVGGRLSLDPVEGLHLEVIGQLITDEKDHVHGYSHTIFGNISSLGRGNDITLFDAAIESGRYHGSFSSQHLRAQYAFLGLHLHEPRFSSIKISLDRLNEWIPNTSFTVSGTDEEYVVSYRQPLARSSAWGGNVLRIVRDSRQPWTTQHEVRAREHVYIEFTPPSPTHIEVMKLDCIWKFQNFLTFVTQKPTEVTQLRALAPDSAREVEVFYRQDTPRIATDRHRPSLLPYRKYENRIPEIIGRWYDLYKLLGPTMDLMFAELRGEYRFLESRFLAWAQVAESLHRRLFPTNPSEIQEYETRVEEILSELEKEDARWLKRMTRFGYEPRFQQRLIALADRISDGENGLFIRWYSNRKRRNRVFEDIADWRNKLTHLSTSTDEISDAGSDLDMYTFQLSVLVRSNIMLELGITKAELAENVALNELP